MENAEHTKASSQLDEAVITQFTFLNESTNIRTFRELISITSNLVNDRLNPKISHS